MTEICPQVVAHLGLPLLGCGLGYAALISTPLILAPPTTHYLNDRPGHVQVVLRFSLFHVATE